MDGVGGSAPPLELINGEVADEMEASVAIETVDWRTLEGIIVSPNDGKVLLSS